MREVGIVKNCMSIWENTRAFFKTNPYKLSVTGVHFVNKLQNLIKSPTIPKVFNIRLKTRWLSKHFTVQTSLWHTNGSMSWLTDNGQDTQEREYLEWTGIRVDGLVMCKFEYNLVVLIESKMLYLSFCTEGCSTEYFVNMQLNKQSSFVSKFITNILTRWGGLHFPYKIIICLVLSLFFSSHNNTM